MITRIILIGPSRINEAAITLSFDDRIQPQPDITYIISPYPQHKLDTVFAEFDIDSSAYTLLDDLYFEDFYDLSAWKHDHWFYQQALKLCAIDHFKSDITLIQDCDQVYLKPFVWYDNGVLVLKAEDLWNPFQHTYIQMITQITGLPSTVDYSLVNELMPITFIQWQDLKKIIEDRNNCNWLKAIERARPFDQNKWLSEYELLGMYITAKTTNWRIEPIYLQPHIDSWDDFFAHDWSKHDTIKFLTQPLKYISADGAKKVIEHIKNLTSN